MAHELTTINGKVSMAFTGETPWHGLGQSMTEGATIDQWTTEAGFDWQALASSVQFTTTDGQQIVMPEKQVIYRSDTLAPLSVMGDNYKIVQPREVMEFFRDLTEQGGWHIHTAGVMGGGRKMWALARNHTEGDVIPGDRVKGNLLLATSLDGSMPTIAGMTCIRVVCANTLRLALRDRNMGKMSRVSHRSQFDAQAVKTEIGVARETFDDFMAQARYLAEQPIALEEAREILRGIFGKPHASKGATPSVDGTALLTANINLAVINPESELSRLLRNGDKPAREQKSVARALELFNGEGRGSLAEGVAGTRWGLFNAVTEHIDHEQGRTPDARLQSAWFGRGDDFKQATLTALLKA